MIGYSYLGYFFRAAIADMFVTLLNLKKIKQILKSLSLTFEMFGKAICQGEWILSSGKPIF